MRINFRLLLGLHIENNLSWQTHVKTIISKCNIHLHFLRKLKSASNKIAELKLYFTACIRFTLEYEYQLCSTSLIEDLVSALEDITISLSHHYGHKSSQLDYSMQLLNLKLLAHWRKKLQNRFFTKS